MPKDAEHFRRWDDLGGMTEVINAKHKIPRIVENNEKTPGLLG